MRKSNGTKKKVNGKNKGSQYERAMSKKFSMWWCKDTVSLFRNSGSGNRHVQEVYSGDLAPASDKAKPWPLSIELKKSEQWSIEGFLQHNPSEPLLEHMVQCLSCSRIGCNKIPLLVCAKNRQKALCFVYPYGLKINFNTKPIIARLKWLGPIPDKILDQYPWDGPVDFLCLHLSTFFRHFTPKDFDNGA